MKYGVMFANTLLWAGPKALFLAQNAEELNYDSLWTVEHVVLPKGFKSPYPYSKDGRMPGGEDAYIPDPLIWLSYVGGATTKIKLATGILILAQRNPIITAKEIATLDYLTNSRVILGVGIGWLKEEFEALGANFSNRSKITEEYIEALRCLWTQDVASYSGNYVNFSQLKMNPKPLHGPPPVIIGGHSVGAAKRAGKLGDGFFPAVSDPETVRNLIEIARREATQQGKNLDSFEITVGARADKNELKFFADLGVHRVVTTPFFFDENQLKNHLESFAELVESL